MRYRKGGTRQKNAHAARRNVCAIVRAVYVLCTFCFLPLVLLVLRNSLICSHACFTLTFCSFTFCFIPRIKGWETLVITVGALCSNGNISYFSQTGDKLDVVAPGVDVLSTLPNNETGLKDGTSMACPHVAGLAALILERNPPSYRNTS